MLNSENFDKIPKEKQYAILSAAFSCFGKGGYKKTAMNEIATTAGVSKASLFHYFGTKKGLYLYLYQFASNEISTTMEDGAEDFFECIEMGARVKYEVIKKYPGIFEYMIQLAREPDKEIIDELKKIGSDKMNVSLSKFFANVDWGRLKPGVDAETAINLASWISYGISNSENALSKSWEELVMEYRRYLDIIKQAIYKEEYL